MIEDYYALWFSLLDALRPVWVVFVAIAVGGFALAVGLTGDR
ncbi:hypothetical protein [Microlunatus sp. GCM10028923]